VDLPITGVLWYQGESNTDTVEQAAEYRLWLQALIGAYRRHWHCSTLPFVVVQLPEYRPDSEAERSAWQVLRDSQTAAVASRPGAVLVDTSGLGDLEDIHPKRKQQVGVRAAEAACRLLDARLSDAETAVLGVDS